MAKVVAVLFTDLVGSTDLMSRVGPDRAEALRVEHFGLLRGALDDHAGHEVKNLGDGLMAVFESASDAIAAAVTIQQRVEAHNRQADERLEVRMGAAVGEADAVDGDYFGPPIVEAARLCATAAGGEVLATAVVEVLAGARGDHRFEPIGEVELRGFDQPVPVVRVGWEPLHGDALTGLPFPHRLVRPTDLFVGRAAELTALAAACSEVSAGPGRRVVLIGGEPGIGKTTLVSHFAAHAHRDGMAVAYGRCDEDLAIPYQPWREIFTHLVEHELVSGDAVRELIGRPGEIVGTDSDADRYRLFTAVGDSLSAASRDHPLLLVIDDLHWGDGPTANLLHHVISTTHDARLLVVATFRDADLAADHPTADLLARLHRQENIDRLTMQGWGDDEVHDLLTELSGHELDDDAVVLRDALRAETDGNPFFTVEILRHLAETDALTFNEATERWEVAAHLRDHGLPVSILEVTGRRVARLGADAQHVLQLASVIGRDFEVEVLADVADLPVEEVLDVLDAAAANALVVEIDADRFCFSHALIERTLNAELSATRRARTHHAIAESLEHRLGPEPGPRTAELAHHWSRATAPADSRKALRYVLAAGDYALAHVAPEEALRWYRQGLDLLDHLRSIGGVDLAGPEGIALELDLTIGFGTAQRRVGDQGFRTTLLHAGHRAADAGLVDRLVRAVLATNRGAPIRFGLADPDLIGLLERAVVALDGAACPSRTMVLAGLSTELVWADSDRALALARQAVDEAAALGDPRTTAWALTRAAHTALRPDTFREHASWSCTAVDAAMAVGDPVMEFEARVIASTSCLLQGDLRALDEHLTRRRDLLASIQHPFGQWANAFLDATRVLLAGDIGRAEPPIDVAYRLGIEGGLPDTDVLLAYGAQQATLRDMQGRMAEMVDLLREAYEATPAVAALRAGYVVALVRGDRLQEAHQVLAPDIERGFDIPFDISWTTCMVAFAEAVHRLELEPAAEVLYRRLLPFASQVASSGLSIFGVIDGPLGTLATTTGRYDEAESHFARAAARHEQMDAAHLLARTRARWAEMLTRRAGRDDLHRARELAALVHDSATERGYAALLVGAEDVLART